MAMKKAGFVKYAHVGAVEVIPELNFQYINGEVRLGDRRLGQMDPILLDPSKFLYTRERAISAYERFGLNGNYDGWIEPELLQCYQSFVHVPRYVDHENTDPSRAVGIVLDAVYHPMSDGEHGGWVETVSARDRAKMAEVTLYHLPGQPSLLEAVQNHGVTDVSMGCFVDESVCTICGNKARDVVEYCDHIAMQKGARLKISGQSPLVSMGASPGDLVVVGELNFGVTFFELSDITTQITLGGGGADPDAKILERLAMKAPSGWERYLIDRAATADMPGRQANGRVAGAAETHYRFSDQEVENMPRRKAKTKAKAKKAEWSDPSLKQVVVPSDEQISQETQPTDYMDDSGQADKDKALLDQSQKPSPEDLDQVVMDPDENVSQETDAEDYPQPDKMGKKRKADFIPTTSDPADTVGGKPDEVVDAEEEVREEKFEDVEPMLAPGDAAEVEDEMHEEMEEERSGMERKMNAALTLLSRKSRSTERVAQKRDAFDHYLEEAISFRLKAKKARSKGVKAKHANTANGLLVKAHACLRDILSYGDVEEEGGNQQPIVDAEGYDQGDPDANLLDQSQGESEPAEESALVETEEEISQAERPDHPHEGDGKTVSHRRTGLARKVIRATNFDPAVDEMATRLSKGEDWETVRDEVFDEYGEPALGLSNRGQRRRRTAQGLDILEPEEPEIPEAPGLGGDMVEEGQGGISGQEMATPEMDMGAPGIGGDDMMMEEGKCKKPMAATEHPELAEDEIPAPRTENETGLIRGEGKRRKRRADTDPAKGSEYTNVEDDTRDLTTDKDDTPSTGEGVDPDTLKVKGRKGKRAENEEELDDTAGESATDLSTDVAEDAGNDDLIGRGTTRTKASPETRGVTDTGSELIQLSRKRQAVLARVRGKVAQGEEVQERLDEGTDLTKASPSTTEIADGQNSFQTEETESLSKGQSAEPAPPVLSGKDLLVRGLVHYRNKLSNKDKEIARLRESNERYQRRTQEVCRAWKWDQCRKLGMLMLRKGFFRQDKEGKQHSEPDQKRLAYKEAEKFMRLSNDEIESRMEIVGKAANPESLVPKWRHNVLRPHPEAVRRPHATPSRTVEARQDELGDDIFVDDPTRGF